MAWRSRIGKLASILAAPALSPAGADEAGDAEISEEREHRNADEQAAVRCWMHKCGAPLGTQPPHRDCGREREDAEEDARDLQPQNAGEPDRRFHCGFAEAAKARPDPTGLS
jgi:hypothetical protein